MDLLILNKNLEVISVFDVFESLIWTDRYCGYGDFEIHTRVTDDILDIMQEDFYVRLMTQSDHAMIIEDREINSNSEDGEYITISGRSLESILDRRIVWGQTVLSGNFQSAIQKLLNENVISPSITDRKISNFIFETSTDPAITSLTVDAQFMWTNLYETIYQLCQEKNVGFKISISSTNQFIFKLYAGADRSYGQTTNPYVTFSPKFDNLITTNYFESKKILKNVTLVTGEGEGSERKATIVGSGASLERRETYTDASDLSQTVDEVVMTDEEYAAQLSQRGQLALSEFGVQHAFDSQVETDLMYIYGKDFFMGDVVQVQSGYGLESSSRVIELIISQDLNGVEVYPTFETVDDAQPYDSSGLIMVPGGGAGVGGSSGGGSGILLKTTAPTSAEGKDGDICIVYS